MKTILKNLKACDKAIEWVEDKTIEEAVNECPRGDWMLWLAQELDVDFKALTLAKGLCANTVRHLMIDKRSIKAVDTAIAFGSGEATIEELMDAAASAASASTSYAAYTTYAYDPAAAYAASAAYASVYASDAADASTSWAASAYASASTSYAASNKDNQLLTANICRKYLGQFIIDKCK